MPLISIEQARAHCKADSADDELLEVYLAAAERSVAAVCNRSLFSTTEERAAAITAASPSVVAAYAAYDTAMENAESVEDERVRNFMEDAALAELNRVIAAADNDIHGIVADSDVIAAVMLTLGHLWANREDVVAGPSMAALPLPNGAYNLAFPHRRLGVM